MATSPTPHLRPAHAAPPRPAPRLLPALPLLAAAAALVLVLPDWMSFPSFLYGDPGASLAATHLAALGVTPLSFPYGPLTLALQQLSLLLPGGGPLDFCIMNVAALGLLAWMAARLIPALRLGVAAATLLAAVVALTITSLPGGIPVYALEATTLVAALSAWARARPAAALAWCIAATLIKPSMGLVWAAWYGAALLWAVARATPVTRRRAWRNFLPATLVAIALLTLLAVWLGPRPLARLLSPALGMRIHRAAGMSWFTPANNPYVFRSGVHSLHFLVGTPLLLWPLSWLLLAAVLLRCGPPPPPPATSELTVPGPGCNALLLRWYAAWGCVASSLAFTLLFYGWRDSYTEYLYLPLLGLIILPLPTPRRPTRRWRAALGALTLIALLATFNDVRHRLGDWRQLRPSSVTAGLWASPADSAAWQHFTAANPPSSHPLFLLDMGAPEALFRAYGTPWHAYMLAGATTPQERAQLSRRLVNAPCVAWRDGRLELTPAQFAAIQARQPHAQVGDLFATFGCAP